MVDAVTDFLVTGRWRRPIDPERYWTDIINSRIDVAMSWYCSHQARSGMCSVKAQIHALDSFNSAIVELEYCILKHESVLDPLPLGI